MVIKRCDSQSVEAAVGLVDQVFFHDKGRQGSVRERLPNLFSAKQIKNIYVAWVGSEMGGVVVTKPFRWCADGRNWRGVMVGFVCTAASLRGQGLGSSLMRRVQADILAQNVDFGVLWTTTHAFYQKLGWELADEGRYGLATGEIRSVVECADDGLSVGAIDASAVEQLRKRSGCRRVCREPADYAAIPPSVEAVDWFHHWRGGTLEAYALVGRCGSTGRLLEMAGRVESFCPLWHSARRAYSAFYANVDLNSASGRWLAENQLVQLLPQQHAHWLRSSTSPSAAVLALWYVPYFDRI